MSTDSKFGPTYVPDYATVFGPNSRVHTPVPNAPTVNLSPEQKEQIKELTAVKYDAGKTDWSLVPWDSIEETVKVLQFGAGKYSPWNWAESGGFKYSRLFSSSMRHFIAWFWKKEDLDPETGISHLAHLSCNVLFLLHYVLNKNNFKNNDDRKV